MLRFRVVVLRNLERTAGESFDAPEGLKAIHIPCQYDEQNVATATYPKP